jgi:hypothetical protein
MDVEPQKEISPKVCVTSRNTQLSKITYSIVTLGINDKVFQSLFIFGIKTIDTKSFQIYSFENKIRKKLSNKVL